MWYNEKLPLAHAGMVAGFCVEGSGLFTVEGLIVVGLSEVDVWGRSEVEVSDLAVVSIMATVLGFTVGPVILVAAMDSHATTQERIRMVVFTRTDFILTFSMEFLSSEVSYIRQGRVLYLLLRYLMFVIVTNYQDCVNLTLKY